MKMASSSSHRPTWANDSLTFGSGDTFLLLNIFPDEIATDLFYNLKEEIKWNTMRQKGKRVPREISIQGTIHVEHDDEYEPLYRHPADEQPELVPWTPTAKRICQRIEQVIEQKLNHALIQCYRTGKDNIGEHSDKTLDIEKYSNIVNYSLGAARTMTLMKKRDPSNVEHIKLPHNSLFVLGWRTNREWKHMIRPDKRKPEEKDEDECAFYGERISLTLRNVATYLNRRTGQIYGQGARCKTLEQMMNQVENFYENDEIAMVKAFGAENQQSSEFDWDKHYGQGFDALNFKVLNGQKKNKKY